MSSQIPQRLRDTVINRVLRHGESNREVARSLEINEKTVRRIISRYNTTGETTPLRRGGDRKSLLSNEIAEQIVGLMNDNFAYNLGDIKRILNVNVSIATIWRWLKKLNYTYKLIRTIPQSRNCTEVKLERKNYVEWYLNIPLHKRYRNVIYVDESPFNLHMIRNHGYSLAGTTPNLIVGNSRGPNISMILAVNCINIIKADAVVGSGVNAETFQSFLLNLVEILGTDEEFIIVMDNVRFHHSNPTFYENYPYQIKYLPRYSPFLNPCEETFSKIKNSIRDASVPNGTDELIRRMITGCNSVSETDLSNFVNHVESFFQMCGREEDIGR